MINIDSGDTICAIATPSGNGAIAIIRLSGKKAITIGDEIIESKTGHLAEVKGNTIHYGLIKEVGNIIDEVLVSVFKAPHSYTGEDILEISCHGSPFIQQRILQLLIANGARLAKPGEFTQRAFLNAKLDLAQAEAVADLIRSSSDASHRIAMDQMRGGFSSEISNLRQRLLRFISLIELELDFSEEDVEFADRKHLCSLLDEIIAKLNQLKSSFKSGNVIKNGIPVVIAGLPNVGKSTLLNDFLNEERAIVSELPGTTRDVIEDEVHIEGFLFRFIDTAGLRHTEDKIEMIGIRKAYEKLIQSRIILLICDVTEDVEIIASQIEALGNEIRQKVMIVLNKVDLLDEKSATIKSNLLARQFRLIVVSISAKNGYQIENLKSALVDSVKNELSDDASVIVSNIRHYEALSRSLEASQRALTGLGNHISPDFIAQDIREILHYLGEITGEITNDEILGNIFANFCIGK